MFHAAKYGLPHLVKSQGVLVNTGSTFGMVGAHYASAYCASKGGVINLTRQLAVPSLCMRSEFPSLSM